MDNLTDQIDYANRVISDADVRSRSEELAKLTALNKRWSEFWASFSKDAAALANRYDADANLLSCAEEDMVLFAKHLDQMIRLAYAKFYVG